MLKTFSSKHDVCAVYRTLPQHAGSETVAFGDENGLAEAVQQADVVVHAALNTRARGKDFIPANRSVTEKLLALIRPGQCRLFVYFSSQVVYSALDPVAHPVQDESLDLEEKGKLDAYTRLKLVEEKRVIEVCKAKGIDYLIVRPTVVMGPHMQWSSGIVDAMRWAPVGLKNRTFNLIHVEDLSAQLLALIDNGVVNEVVNLGDLDVSSDDYFRHAAGLAGRPMFLAPDWLAGAAGAAIPSTLWFLAHDVTVDTQKVRRLSGITTNRALGEFFEPAARVVPAKDLEAIRSVVSSGKPFHTIGRGYFLWFNDKLSSDQLVMGHYAGIVGLEGDEFTVRAGTTLRAMLDFLAPRGLTLGTLPEFVDISAGACFFAEVHGSSADYISVYDLISAIRYIGKDGVEVYLRRDDAVWDKLRAETGIVVTEVTFRCQSNQRLANVIEWHPDTRLEHYVDGGYRANFSTTVHWYPRSHELMVYNVNPVGENRPKDRGPFAPMRGSPALMQKLLLSLRLRGRLRIVGPAEQVLAPWTGVPAKELVGKIFRDGHRRIRNLEVCVPDYCASNFFARLRQHIPQMQINPGQGIGVRFTRQPATDRGFVWVEMTSRNAEQMHAMVDMAREACGDAFWLHRGKYVPRGVGVDHLFIPRNPVNISLSKVTPVGDATSGS
ncbi:NAD-dependent epimerase/dehydratase family protein [Devosia sp. MSA67]|uniref:NAD-dependent epimerase/dehydratase family protein n=1 Tax=Devosia sediminis TaxID=2798801 RepID=A0A934IUQ0_9HYPH|nr:NAD-dependent epimerase/dehydratase family protein [Devosia sediminis]